MKIIITGSSGLLGTELCKIVGKDNRLAGIDKIDPKIQLPELNFYKEDVLDIKAVKRIFDRENADIIIHTAAFTDVDGCETNEGTAYKVNTEVVRDIAEISKKSGMFFMFISTDFVFGGDKRIPYTEVDKPQPVNVYGKTKWLAEKEITRVLERYMIIRTSWLYGENGKNFVDTIISKTATEKSLSIVDDQTGSPTYAKDLADAIRSVILLCKKETKNIFHVSNSGQCSWHDLTLEILRDIGKEGQVKVEPISSGNLARPAKRPCFSVLDITKFQSAFDHKMRSWQKALYDYLS